MENKGDQLSEQNHYFSLSINSNSDHKSQTPVQEHNDICYLQAKEHLSIQASSPSSRYISPELEYRRRESVGSDFQKSSALKEETKRSQASSNLLSHHSASGGNIDGSQRSSSPLKRRASDLENDAASSLKNFEMISVPSSPNRSENESVLVSQGILSKSPENLLEAASNEAISSNIKERQQTKSPDIGSDGKFYPDITR